MQDLTENSLKPSNRPTVAYFVHNLDGYSGAAAQATLLARHVNARIIFFNVPHRRNAVPHYPSDLNVLTLPRNFLLQLIFIIWHAARNGVSIFHFHGLFNAGMLASRLLKKKSILKTTLIDDDDVLTLRKQISWPLRRILLKGITYNICLTQKIAKRNRYFFCNDQIKIIPNGVLIPSAPYIKEFLSFCFVGVVCERKNTKASIEYFIKHYAQIPNSKLYIVGPGGSSGLSNEESTNYLKTCMQLVDEVGLADKVVFTGALSKQATLDIMLRCYGLLFFSEAEGMPNVVLEALSCNCVPIIGPIQGTSKEIIDDGTNGFVVRDISKSVSANELIEIVKKHNALEKANRSYRIDVISGVYNSLYCSNKN